MNQATAREHGPPRNEYKMRIDLELLRDDFLDEPANNPVSNRQRLSPAILRGEYSSCPEYGFQPNLRTQLCRLSRVPPGNIFEGYNQSHGTVPRVQLPPISERAELCGIDPDDFSIITFRRVLVHLAESIHENMPCEIYVRRKYNGGPLEMWSVLIPSPEFNRRRRRNLGFCWRGSLEHRLGPSNFCRRFRQEGILHFCARCKSTEELIEVSRYAGKQFEKKATNGNKDGMYYAFVERNIGRHHLLFTAEMDCFQILPTIGESCMENFVELKALHKCHLSNPNNERIFHADKARSFWLQCHIAGVKNVTIGIYDSEGDVIEVQSRNINEIKNEAMAYLKEERSWENQWDGNSMMYALEYILDEINKVYDNRNIGRTLKISLIHDGGSPELVGEFIDWSPAQNASSSRQRDAFQ